MLESVLKDIESAKENKAYISALSLALTLPDIFIRMEGKRGGAEYSKWFDQWVYDYYRQPESKNIYINKGIEATKFDGKNCYALRCALLHAGNTDLLKNKGRIQTFKLFACEDNFAGMDTYMCDISDEGTSGSYVCLNIVCLIDLLLRGARQYISLNTRAIECYENRNDEKICLVGSIDIEVM